MSGQRFFYKKVNESNIHELYDTTKSIIKCLQYETLSTNCGTTKLYIEVVATYKLLKITIK